MASSTRGRSGKQLDVESLERDNDRGLDALSERVGLLKAATHGIKSEVENQHNLLDNMDGSMGHTRGMLGSVNDKFKLVMSNKQNRNMAVTILGVTGIVVLMWWILRR
ncbi:Qc-SNARE, Bet1/mBET1 family [Haematococcus lacustris]